MVVIYFACRTIGDNAAFYCQLVSTLSMSEVIKNQSYMDLVVMVITNR